jgi:replication factor A1
MYLISKHFIRFKVDCIVTDGNDVATFLMVGKTVENFFGSSAHCYLYDKGFIDCIPPPMIEKLNKDKIFQLRFRAFRSVVNRCDIIVTNVFDDIVTAEAPPLPDEPELHIVDVPLNNQAASSSSKVASPLDPTTPTPVPPSKTNANFSQQPQVFPEQPYMVGPFPSQAKR